MDDTRNGPTPTSVTSRSASEVAATHDPIDSDRLIEAAGRAPSSHNTQPWRFRVQGDAVELSADRSRSLPCNDPADRELTISCGAALFNLRAAASAAGLHTDVLGGASTDHLATVWMRAGDADVEVAELFHQIDRRRSRRGPFDDAVQIVPATIRELARSVAVEGAQLVVVDGSQRAAIADLVAEGDRHQFADRAWRHELATWMRRPGGEDGTATTRLTRAAVSTFDLGRSTARGDAALVATAPLLAVMTTPGDDVDDWLRTGQALERLLLRATALGLDAGFLNQPCQVAALRPRLRELIGGGQPQLVIRLGPSASSRPPMRRRPVGDLVVTDGPEPAPTFGRRSFVRRTALGVGTAIVVADAVAAYRAYDQGVLAEGDGPAFDAWRTWQDATGPVALVGAAVLAANGHNAQPWSFDVHADRIDVHADLTRSTRANDARDRELYISLGCALENMVITAPATGLQADPVPITDEPDGDLVASLALRPARRMRPELYAAIGARHSNRSEYHAGRLPASVLEAMSELTGTGDEPGRLVWLHDDAERAQFGQLVVDATVAHIADDEQSRASFAWWRSDWNEIQRRKDGLNIDGVGLPALWRSLGKILPAPSRASADRTFLERTRIQVRSAAAFGVIVVDDPTTRRDQVAGGRLLQRLHLWATTRQLGFQHMNQITERIDRDHQLGRVSPFEAPLDALVGPGALVAFRVGIPTVPARRSPRRPATEVIR